MAFIVFEGIDGSGKTTLIQKVGDWLKSKGQAATLTREPGGTKLGQEIRELLLRTKGEAPVPRAELLLYEADRAQHVETVIRPALQRGEWVLCDRFTASTVAFQCGGRGLDLSDIETLNSYAVAGCQPDLFVLLDLDVDKSFQRRQGRTQRSGVEQDRFEKEEQNFHQRVRESYLKQAKQNPNSWLVLDATLRPDEILASCLGALEKWRV